MAFPSEAAERNPLLLDEEVESSSEAVKLTIPVPVFLAGGVLPAEGWLFSLRWWMVLTKRSPSRLNRVLGGGVGRLGPPFAARPRSSKASFDVLCEMRCIEFLGLFFSEFRNLESEFQFLYFSTAKFKKNLTGIFGIENKFGILLPMGVPEIGTKIGIPNQAGWLDSWMARWLNRSPNPTAQQLDNFNSLTPLTAE